MDLKRPKEVRKLASRGLTHRVEINPNGDPVKNPVKKLASRGLTHRV